MLRPGLRVKRGMALFILLSLYLTTAPLCADIFNSSNPVIPGVEYSTTPIGSPFLRHYADRFSLDLRKLIQYEERGFGRAEIITLVEISSHTGVLLKEYGKRRLKNEVTLRELAKEANMEYEPLYQRAQKIKTEIEALGNENLPPPVFKEIKDPKKEKKERKKKKKKEKERIKSNDAQEPDKTDSIID